MASPSRTHSWLAPRPIELVPYDPRWPLRFERLAAAMRDALGPVAKRIEHVGSTAVPRLWAKPTIDIQLSVEALDPFETYVEPLERLGYRYRREDDAAEEHRVLVLEREGGRLVNLHVCITASAWERRHVAFRDHLRTNAPSRAAYQAVKQRVIREFPTDVPAYAQAKTPVIRRLERRALGIPDPVADRDDPVVVVPYDPAWPAWFEAEAARIRSGLGTAATGVEHVGSTAVPGLASQPVIDILVDGPDGRSRDALLPGLGVLGYGPGSDGGPGWRLLREDRRRPFHLNVVGTPQEGDGRVAFRDYLRARPDQAGRYGRLKALLAADLREDRPAYQEAKAPYVWVIEQRMREEGFGG